MKKFILLLISLVLISGCIGEVDNVLKNMFSVKAIDSTIEDISVTGRLPTFVIGDRDFPFEITVEAKTDIRDLKIEIFDKCVPFKDNENDYDFSIDEELKEGRLRTFTSGYDVDDVEFERSDCNINFKTSYDSTLEMNQEIVILNWLEYERIESEENISSISTNSFSTVNPLIIDLKFSEKRPLFMNDREVVMHIDYENIGSGKIEGLKKGSVKIKMPFKGKYPLLEILDSSDIICGGDYDTFEGGLILNKDLEFVKNKGPRTTCNFITLKNVDVKETGFMQITADYDYEIVSQIGPIEVREK